MAGYVSSQGTTVTFNSVPLGYLTGFEFEAKAGATTESTPTTASIVGSGGSSRALRVYVATAVEPPTVSITFWGAPQFSNDDAGLVAELSFNAPDNSFSGEAILLSFSHSGRAGQWATGSASFQLTGA